MEDRSVGHVIEEAVGSSQDNVADFQIKSARVRVLSTVQKISFIYVIIFIQIFFKKYIYLKVTIRIILKRRIYNIFEKD